MTQQDRIEPSSRKRLRKLAQIIGSGISTLLFIWLLSKQDWQTTWKHLRLFPMWIWPVCLLLVVTGMFCNALRWYVLLRAQQVKMPFAEVVRTVFAGAFASNFLPSTVGGDAFRILSLLRFTSNRTLSVASVLVDRAVNVTATLTFLPFSWLTFGNQIFEFVFQGRGEESLLVAGIPFLEKWVNIFRSLVQRFLKAFGNWARQPLVLVGAFGISWISILVVYIAVWLLAHMLGIPVSLFQVMGVAAIVYLITLLPVSFNGYGVREVIYATLYMQLGATLEQATTLALVTRFFMLLETLPGALWLSQIMTFSSNSPSDP